MKFLTNILQQDWQEKMIRDAVKKAPAEGKHGRPAPDSINFDANETQYKNSVENFLRKARDVVFEQTRKLEKAVSKYESELEAVRHETDNRPHVNALYQDAYAELQERREKYTELLTKRIACEGNLNAFRVTHQITHEPDHPADQVNFMSVVFLIFAVECVFNAYFWKGEDGLIGGIVAAMIFAFVNIVIALVMGIFFRQKNLNTTRNQYEGWTALFLAIIIGCIIAVWVATQRSAKEIEKLITPDLGAAFSTVPSALFLFGTLIAAGIAFHKGYHVFGTVPGYKRVSDDFRSSDETASEMRSTIKKASAEVYEKAINLCGTSVRQLKDIQRESVATQSDLKAVDTEFDLTSSQILSGYKTILKIYRETNLSSRPSNIPGPIYWGEPLELDLAKPDDLQRIIIRADELVEKADTMNLELGGPLQEEKTLLMANKGDFLTGPWEEFLQNCSLSAIEKFKSKIAFLGKLE